MEKDSCPKTLLTDKDIDRLKKDRRWFHAHPELAFKEEQTASFIQNRLTELNIPFVKGYAGTGIVAQIKGNGQSEQAIGFRSDMDALRMQEENQFAHHSIVSGKMHGCGHDGHLAIMLGLAKVLSTERCFDGKIYLIFQPGEEGGLGAKQMVEQGLFSEYPMDRIFALHNWPELPAGVIGSLRGPMMASAHSIEIKITGRGGHGAMPHHATPQITVAAHIQLAINSYLSQQKDSRHAAIISLTQVAAGKAFAVLPSSVTLKGSCRFLDEETAAQIYREIPHLIENIAASFGACAEVTLNELCSVTRNDPDATDMVRMAATSAGLEQANEANGLMPSMVSEDFAYMLKSCPGCYFWIGQNDEKHKSSLHQPNYDFNDATIRHGVSICTEIAKIALPAASS